MNIRSSLPRSNAPSSIAAAHGDPASALVHAAVADRPLEEVANLITLLEQSPQYARAAVDALRAVGTDRSVEDVTHLVALLTRPPRDLSSADEAIRAAVENRPVEEVTRLLALLHRASKEHPFGQEAARTAVSARPIEDLVELIGRLSEERTAHATRPKAEPTVQMPSETEWKLGGIDPPPLPTAPPSYGGRAVPKGPTHAPKRPAVRPSRPGLLVSAALFLCALLSFPMYQAGEPVQAYVFGVAVSVLCALLAVLVTLRPVSPTLVVAAVVPTLLAAAELYRDRFHSTWLSQALGLTLAPGWIVGLVAVIAALSALTALVLHVAARPVVMSPRSNAMATASRPE